MTTLAEQIAALKLEPLTEAEHAKYLGLTPAQYEKIKPKLSADQIAFHEQARAVEALAPLWESGVEPYPSDVSVNRGRKRKARQQTPSKTPEEG